jgi:predicted nucleic acid-binding protein
VIYLDSSALVRLVHQEPESIALRTWLAAHDQPRGSSDVTRTETTRAVLRYAPAGLPALEHALSTMFLVPITEAILGTAGRLPPPTLRGLDAIHLATAESLGSALTWFVAYDKRLLETAAMRGLPVASPS